MIIGLLLVLSLTLGELESTGLDECNQVDPSLGFSTYATIEVECKVGNNLSVFLDLTHPGFHSNVKYARYGYLCYTESKDLYDLEQYTEITSYSLTFETATNEANCIVTGCTNEFVLGHGFTFVGIQNSSCHFYQPPTPNIQHENTTSVMMTSHSSEMVSSILPSLSSLSSIGITTSINSSYKPLLDMTLTTGSSPYKPTPPTTASVVVSPFANSATGLSQLITNSMSTSHNTTMTTMTTSSTNAIVPSENPPDPSQLTNIVAIIVVVLLVCFVAVAAAFTGLWKRRLINNKLPNEEPEATVIAYSISSFPTSPSIITVMNDPDLLSASSLTNRDHHTVTTTAGTRTNINIMILDRTAGTTNPDTTTGRTNLVGTSTTAGNKSNMTLPTDCTPVHGSNSSLSVVGQTDESAIDASPISEDDESFIITSSPIYDSLSETDTSGGSGRLSLQLARSVPYRSGPQRFPSSSSSGYISDSCYTPHHSSRCSSMHSNYIHCT